MSRYLYITTNINVKDSAAFKREIEVFFKNYLIDKIPENLRQYFRINLSQGKFGIYFEPFLGDKTFLFFLEHKKNKDIVIQVFNLLIDFISLFNEEIGILIFTDPPGYIDDIRIIEIESMVIFLNDKLPKQNTLIHIKNQSHLYEFESLEILLNNPMFLDNKKIDRFYQSYYVISISKKRAMNIVSDYISAQNGIIIDKEAQIRIANVSTIPFPILEIWNMRKDEEICYESGRIYF